MMITWQKTARALFLPFVLFLGILMIAISFRWADFRIFAQDSIFEIIFLAKTSLQEKDVQFISRKWWDDVHNSSEKNTKMFWSEIGEFKLTSHGKLAKKWEKEVILPFRPKRLGKLNAEIFFTSWKDEKNEAVILQVTFSEKKTRNFVGEFSNTYFVSGDPSNYDLEKTPGLVNFVIQTNQRSKAKNTDSKKNTKELKGSRNSSE